MEKSLTDLDYSANLESLLASFPPSELKAPLRRGLTRNATRESAARVVGQTGDPELGKILIAHARTADEDFKLAVGEGLVLCRQPQGLPLLIDCLKSSSSSTRIIAIDALRRVNQGKDFGYRAPFPPARNAQALKSWEEWNRNFGNKIFEQR